MNFFPKKIGVTIAGLLLLLPLSFGAFPRPAAALTVYDPINWIQNNLSVIQETIQTGLAQGINLKEYGLDPIAYVLAQTALNSMTQSVVNWVGSGFNGSPAFVSDLQGNLLRLGDASANRVLDQLARDGRIDSPFKTEVLATARRAYYQNTGSGAYGAAHPYTLNETCANDAAFSAGSYFDLDCFAGAFRNPANNVFGSQLLATDAVLQEVSTAEENRREELRQGNGFLSWRQCDDQANPPAGEPIDLTQVDDTANCPVQSPGSVIYSGLQDVMGAGVARLTSADEINEIISGLLSSLLTDVLHEGLGNVSSSINSRSAGSAGTAVDTGVVSTLRSSIANQKTALEPYRAAWQTILDAANAAKTKLDTCNSNNAARRGVIQDTISRATAGVSVAVTSIAKLTELDTRIQATNSQSQAMAAILKDYQDASSALPNPQDISNTITQSQDIEGATPPTLYQEMTTISRASCRTLGGN